MRRSSAAQTSTEPSGKAAAGEYFCAPRGAYYATMPRDFNRSIRSIRVFGGAEVRMFTDHDYHGRSGEVRRDVGDLHGMWRDSVESIRVW